MDFTDPQQVALKLIEANDHGEWQLASACMLILLVFLARKFGPKIPGKAGKFFASGLGGSVLSFVVGQLGAVGTALVAGTPLSLRLVMGGVVMSLIGSGAHAQGKQVKQSRTKALVTPAAAALLLTVITLSGCATSFAATFEGLAKVEQLNGDFASQFPKINKGKLDAIVAAAPTKADGETALQAWNVVANRLVTAVDGTHATAQLARDNVDRIRKGLQDKKDYPRWAALAVKLAFDLKDLLLLSGVNLAVGVH